LPVNPHASKALVFGLLTLLCCCFALPALFFGHKGMRHEKEAASENGKAFCIVGLIFGYSYIAICLGLFLYVLAELLSK
jgi:hypothetical protein